MVLFEIHQRFKGHCLNKLRVSFKFIYMLSLHIFQVLLHITSQRQLKNKEIMVRTTTDIVPKEISVDLEQIIYSKS